MTDEQTTNETDAPDSKDTIAARDAAVVNRAVAALQAEQEARRKIALGDALAEGELLVRLAADFLTLKGLRVQVVDEDGQPVARGFLKVSDTRDFVIRAEADDEGSGALYGRVVANVHPSDLYQWVRLWRLADVARAITQPTALRYGVPEVAPTRPPNHGSRLAFPSGTEDTDGMTKREYFAAAALQGIASAVPLGHPTDQVAAWAVAAADALLAALNA